VTGKVREFAPEKLDRWGRFAIDADIRRGNSGGPVIDDRGYVVGVVSAKVNTPAMFQRTGQVMRDIGLIIRQDRALRFLERFNVA
jgi:serine protease Do